MVLVENRAYQGTYITICNYESYQNQGQTEEQAEEQAGNKRGTSGGTINNKENNANNENKNNVNGKNIPPPLSEVEAYCTERKNGINAQAFIDFYESKAWMIGKNKMKNWMASVRTWEKNNIRQGNQTTVVPKPKDLTNYGK